MFDNICKFIAETFTTDLATWLLGKPVDLTQLSPKELSSEPIRADALILLQSEEVILHLEFQTQPDASIPFRMADYRLRVYRRFPQKSMYQVVIYLTETKSPEVYKDRFEIDSLQHEFRVIRLWEQPTAVFLGSSGLLPFAVLSNTNNQATTLQRVADEINKVADKRMQSNLTASTAVLAGLVLKQEVIQRLLRQDIMRESVIYQLIRTEGKQEGIQQGIQQGIQEGKQEGKQEIALNLLGEGMTIEAIARVTGLSVEVVQKLQQEYQP